MTFAEWLFLVAIAAAATGYAVGRRVGLGEGRAEGLASAPLALRTRALEAGRCPICGRVAQAPPDPPDSPDPSALGPPAETPSPPASSE
ncbi:MAG: hypothetical protein ACYC6V_00535 [Bacillota bacterium]